jgi:hypothetical protein
MTPHLYDYEQIRAAWDAYLPVRVRYSPEETGWALRLGPDHVCLANVPLTDDLFELDICELAPSADPAREDLPEVGRVVQRYYTQRALLRYVCPDAQEELLRRYRTLAAILRARDCAIEGIVPGAAQVQAPAGCDVPAAITAAAAEAGIELLRVTMGEDEDEDEDNA